jgi:hypothetical protein
MGWSYRYTVTMSLPHNTVLKYRTGEKVSGIFNLVFNTKCTAEFRPLFAPRAVLQIGEVVLMASG